MIKVVEYDINYKTESWFELVSDNVEENWRSHWGQEITEEGMSKIVGYFTDGDKDISDKEIMELYNITEEELNEIKKDCINTICELIIDNCNERLWQDLEREWLD